MWNLFKEVFRSLKKNKVTLIGLTILIFLSSGIFTLFHDMSKVMKVQYNKYKTLSNGHDLTVDLNIPSSGTFFNDGYYINGLTQANGGIYYDKPINYISGSYSLSRNIIVTELINDNYILLSNFIGQNSEFSNKYIRKNDFIKFYNSLLDPNFSQQGIILDYSGSNKHFKINQNYSFNTYTKNGNDFEIYKVELKPNKNVNFIFDKNYKISNLLNLEKSDNKIYFSQLPVLYVNLKTNQLTFDFVKGKHWEEQEQSYKIFGNKLARLFGLVALNDNEFVFVRDNLINSVLVNFPTDETNLQEHYNTNLNQTFTYNQLFGNENASIDVSRSFTFQENKDYLIPNKWAAIENEKTFYQRKLYTTTYDAENKDKWKGSYKTFISNIFDGNDEKLKTKYSRFAYWDKNIERFVTYFDANGNPQKNQSLINSSTLTISMEDVNKIKLQLAPKSEQPEKVNLANFITNQEQTIAQIEGFEQVDSEEYKILTSKLYKENLIKTIREGALSITKKNITDKVIELVDKDKNNVGLRQTTTVDSVDDQGKKTVLHFVNIGNNQNLVNGVELNVDKLINESTHKTALTQISTSIDSFFKTKQINSFIAKEILNNSKGNISPLPEYLIPDYSYNTVIYTDKNNGISSTFKAKKTYRLTNLIKDENSNLLNNFNGYGVAITNDYKNFILLKAINNDDGTFSHWVNVSLKENINGILTTEQLYQYMLSQNWTLRLSYVNPNGWGRIDPQFPNIVSLPFYYRGPKFDILQEALNKNSLALALEYIQKTLYDSDLIKKGFISKEEIYAFIEGANYAINQNDFARIFSSGNINLIIVPKMALDLVYSLSHNPKGDFLSRILDSVLKHLITILEEKGTLEQQKAYLKTQIENIYSFTNGLFALDLNKIIDPVSLLDFIKDPKVFLQALRDIISGFDFRTFSDKVNEFFKKDYNKKELRDGVERERKISITEIMVWLFESSNQSIFKNAVYKILDNFNTKALFESPSGIKALLKSFIPSGDANINEIIEKINNVNNPPDKKYSNFIDGIKFFINSFDLNIFLKTLSQNIKLSNFDQTSPVINKITGQNELVTKYYFAGSVNNIDIYYSFFKSFFNVPSADKIFKEQIIKMLNLSSKGTSIKISDKKFFNVPTNDNEKLGFFDLLNLNFQESSNSLRIIDPVLNSIKNLNELKYDSLTQEQKDVLVSFLGLKVDQNLNKEELKSFIEKWESILSLLKLNTTDLKYKNNLSIGSLAYFFKNYNNNFNSAPLYGLIKKLIDQILANNPLDQYSYSKYGLPLFREWWILYKELANVSHERRIEFLNKWLELANSKEVIDSFNNFDLFKPSSQNIALAKETNFGISRSLANPNKMKDLFFDKESDQYKNPKLNELIQQYPEFIDTIKKHEFGWTVAFSQIAASNMYFDLSVSSIDGVPLKYHALQSVVIDNFINGFLNNSLIKENVNNIDKIFNSLTTFSISSIGIPDVVLNPLLISFYPQLLVWYLTNTDDIDFSLSENINLAYFIKSKLINFEEIAKLPIDQFKKWIENFAIERTYNSTIESDFTFAIAIDDDFFTWWKKNQDYIDGKYNVFGINLVNFIIASMDAITAPIVQNNFLTFSQSSSYVVKANYAWLAKNNKKIYTGSIPQNPTLVQDLINKLDKDFLIEVNGSKFIIVGDDSSFDYLYPVIDENNLQVDTQNQAILYVNDKGFSRIRYSYIGNTLKEYLVVKKPNNADLKELKSQIDETIRTTIDNPNRTNWTYSTSDLDGLNPERSIRISAIEKIIKSVSAISFQLSFLMIFIVSISIIFIIKRYVSNKNKVLGILIAQGYTQMQIALSMTAFAFITSLVGGISGYLLGFINQALGLKIISAYWTIPIETLSFSFTSFALTVILPMFGMSLLIFIITIYSLRWKAIELMGGIADLSIGNLQQRYQKLFSKNNIKTKFSASLIFNSFWKLSAFGFSIILTSIATIFQFSTLGVFEKSINKTYQNRDYSYKLDLITPTIQGGALMPFDNDVKNNLYVPIGNISEFNQTQSSYFQVGHSNAINIDGKNGDPNEFDAHVITQFSVNLKIDANVSLDPWTLIYNNLPDSVKARINKLRNQIALLLEKTQSFVVFNKDNTLNLKETAKSKKDFFHYVPNIQNPVDGKFYYLKWNEVENQYEDFVITTSKFRDEYHDFLVNAYAKIPNGSAINDYFVSFFGIYFNDKNDEPYTYVDSNYKNSQIRLYGYMPNSTQLKLIDEKGINLLKLLNDNFEQNKELLNEPIPLVINNVVKDKYKLSIGSQISIPVLNTTDRYEEKINAKLNGLTYIENPKTYTFKVIGINPTFINNEFIIPKKAADKITGLDKLKNNPKYGPFNGILSKDKIPQQLLNSATVYSYSGYAGALQSFDTKSSTLVDKQNIYDALFASKATSPNVPSEGLFKKWGWSDAKIAKFIDPNFDSKNANAQKIQEVYDKGRASPDAAIGKFAEIFDNVAYVAAAQGLDSKDIEVGFTTTIAKTVQIIVTFITLLTFIVSMIILVIVSTILINENEKNIAIWTILGYSQKEKVRMFFGIYVPFILISILLSIPITYGLITFFSGFLTNAASIAIPLTLSLFSVGLTFIVIFVVFMITSIISWRNINKIKAIDLLKGK
ncbi:MULTISPECIES: ABC transporter permease [unclassified Mycoplasma]|uniref:ABC transporter permease n=1 Tax=unclassified Mycoplasma TaxID=2683645 RepID=UPI00211D0AF6|nr:MULTISPECIES: ABC transporter permease [unclassified Mycoplasma]UUM19822.1 ABC transporter permease [Mycoplasma sp. 1578d]UUM24806.1 ABC transporter permease [Mycoplasma sp. 3686d]